MSDRIVPGPKTTAVVAVATLRTPRKLKLLAAGFLLAALGLLGYEAHAAANRDDADPTITYVVRNHRLLKISVTAATGLAAASFAFLVAHFGFGVA